MKSVYTLFLSLVFTSTIFAQTSDFYIQVSAENGLSLDNSIYLGIHNSATDAYDPGMDKPKPPCPAGNYVYVKIEPMNQSPAFYSAFSEDWRSDQVDLTTQAIFWELEADNSVEDSLLNLNFTINNNSGEVIPVYLVVEDHYYNLLENSEYTSDSSPLEFTIIAGFVPDPETSITDPVEGVTLVGGQSHVCRWDIITTIPIQQTVLSFSDNDGSNWTILSSTDSLLNQYNWDVPEETLNDCLLKVKIVDDLNTSDSSQVSFSILDETDEMNSVELLSPQQGSHLSGGETIGLTWRYENGTLGFENSEIFWSINGIDFSNIYTENSTDTSVSIRVPDSIYTQDFSFVILTNLESGNVLSDTLKSLILCPNIFCNTEFEEWENYGPETGPPDSWDINGDYGIDCNVTRNSIFSLEGFYSAEINILSPGIYYLVQELSGDLVQAGTDFEFKGRIRDNYPGINANLRFEFLDSDASLITYTDGDTTLGSGEFEQCNVIETIPENTEYLRLAIRVEASTTGSIYADYFQLMNPDTVVYVNVTQPTINTEFTFDGSTQLPVEWNYGTTSPFVSSALIEVSLDDGILWSPVTEIPNNTTTSYNWIGVDDYSIQVKIKVTANQETEDEGFGSSETFRIRPSARTDTLQAGWHLYGLQMLPSDTSVNAIFGDDVGSAYYLYDYSNNSGYFTTEYLSNLDGYWLALDEAEVIDVSGVASFTSLNDKIYSGWNLVSSGYPRDVAKNLLKFSDGASTKSFQTAVNDNWIAGEMYGYDNGTGQYYSIGNNGYLQPGEGYWMGVLVDSLDMIVDPPVVMAEQPDDDPHDPDPGRVAWESDIVALIDGEPVEGLVFIGVNPDASDNFDSKYDYPLPPESPGDDLPKLQLVSLSCPEILGIYFSREIKGIMNEEFPLKSWYLAVEKGEEVDLQLDFNRLIEKIPSGYNAYLEFSDMRIDLRQSPLITIHETGELSTELIIEYGADPVDEPGLFSLPEEFSIHHLFPNPFNNQLQIKVGIPYPGTVDLKVFNIRGQLVDVIHSGNLSAGFYDFNWRGTGTSGVYFISMRNSKGNSSIRKVVFIK